MINWIKSANINKINIEDLKNRFKKFPRSAKKIFAICEVCDKERIIPFHSYSTRCKKCASQEYHKNPLNKQKILDAHKKTVKKNTGQKRSGKALRNIQIANNNSENNKKRADSNRGQKRSGKALENLRQGYQKIERNQKISKARKEYFKDFKNREKQSKALKKYYIEHPEACEKSRRRAIEQMKSGFPNKNTSIELKMQDILTKSNYKYETQVPVCNICFPDIVFKTEQIAIFCDGDYWHNYPGGREKDRNQDRILLENGWIPLRFWEHEINENIEDCFYRFELEYFGGEC